MIKTMKMSKYNFITYDHAGNLIIYNFLTGMKSLARVMKCDVNKFTDLFLLNDAIHNTSYEKHKKAVESMLRLGILVHGDIDERVSYDAVHCSEAYDSKLNVTILPTGKCIFRCPYCYEDSQNFHREAMTIDAQNALIKYIQRSIHEHTALKVNWYGGEPLLESETIKYLSEKFIKICNTRHLPYSAEMTTNGYLLNADMFDMLYKLKIYTYMITIDGFKEQHDKVRFTSNGKGSYDVILNNLLRIRDDKQYKFAHIIVRVNVSKDVFNKLDDFVSYVSSLFSDDPRFEITFAAVVSYNKNSLYDSYVDPFKMYESLFCNEVFMNKIYKNELKINQLIPEKRCLAALRNAYVITPDLSIYKCYSFFENDENKVGCINLNGDLLIDETLHKRWYLVNRYVQQVPEKCNNCFYLPCCRYINSGCPIRYNKKQKWQSCILENDSFKEDLSNNILYAAEQYPVTTIIL